MKINILGDKTVDHPIGMVLQSPKKSLRDLLKNAPSILLVFSCVLGYILLSTTIFFLVEHVNSFWDSLYFTFVNTASGGFEEVKIISTTGKIISCLNIIVGLIFLGILVSLLAASFQPEVYNIEGDVNHKTPNTPETSKTTVVFENVGRIFEDISWQLWHYSRRDETRKDQRRKSEIKDISITWDRNIQGIKSISVRINNKEDIENQ